MVGAETLILPERVKRLVDTATVNAYLSAYPELATLIGKSRKLLMHIENGGPRQHLDQIVLFPFDDHSLPLQCGVELHLEGHTTPCGRTRIAVGLGEEGAPDSERVVYYGTVHSVGDELWMWYPRPGPGSPAGLSASASPPVPTATTGASRTWVW